MFVHITQETQDERLLERLEHPWKRWKTGLEDYRNRARRADYLEAMDEMFERTDRKAAPWIVIDGNNKKGGPDRGADRDRRRARSQCLDGPAAGRSRGRESRAQGIRKAALHKHG